tara:strand:- start:236 stop:361 length:126 start_codon:yes stop_codon:yes gene_type:complete
MDKIEKTEEELTELKDRSRNGALVKELLDKINELIEWINKQ